MENLSLTPATQAVLDALTELGQGNVHELADKAGKARSTTDKAIRTLADAGVIVAVETDADPADGTPTQWTLVDQADTTDTAPEAADRDDENPTSLTEELADAAPVDAPEHFADPAPVDPAPIDAGPRRGRRAEREHRRRAGRAPHGHCRRRPG